MSKIALSKNEIIKETNSSIKLSDGAYQAVIVGILISNRAAFKEGEDPFPAIRFALQLSDDDGKIKIQQTNDLRLSLSEKSSLFKQLSSWCKSASPDELWEKLRPIGIIDANDNFDYDKMLGKHVQLMVTMKQSKKDATKFFPELQFSTPKKGQTFDPVVEADKLAPIWLPNFVNDADVLDTVCLEGFEWKRYEEKDGEQSSAPSRDELAATTPAQSKTEPANETKPEKAKVANSAKPTATAAPKNVVSKLNVPSASEIDESEMPF
jgi:hypothetical protein